MKKSLVILTALIPVLSIAQKSNFTITGKIGKLNAPARVYIDYSSNGESVSDSADLKNGKFVFKGRVDGYSFVRMGLDHTGKGKDHAVYVGDVNYFYFKEGEKMKITSNDSIANARFSGSKAYQEYSAYNDFIGGTIMEFTKKANAEYSAGTEEQRKDTNFVKTINASFMKRITDRAERQIQFARENPHSWYSVVALSEAAGAQVDVPLIRPIFEAIDEKYRNTDMARELSMRMEAVNLTAIGTEAPMFIQNDLNGKPISLKDLRGKTVLLEFWASWCSPCRAENPNLRAQYARYKEKGFEILGVSLDDNRDKWKQAIDADGLPWIHVSDLKGWGNAVGRLYGVRAVPASFLSDADGKIIGSNLRGKELNAKLDELFGAN